MKTVNEPEDLDVPPLLADLRLVYHNEDLDTDAQRELAAFKKGNYKGFLDLLATQEEAFRRMKGGLKVADDVLPEQGSREPDAGEEEAMRMLEELLRSHAEPPPADRKMITEARAAIARGEFGETKHELLRRLGVDESC